MGRVIGTDLGVTYSSVAIPEKRTGSGFLIIKEIPGCSVILDRLNERGYDFHYRTAA